MSEALEYEYKCPHGGCIGSFKYKRSLRKHIRDEHPTPKLPSTRQRNNYYTAQASRNSANRRKRSAQPCTSPNTEETDKKKKTRKSPTTTNSKRPPAPAPAPARSANLLHDIAGSVSKPPDLFHGIDLNTPGDDKCQGSDGWWRRCKRFNNTNGKLCKQWFFWHETMKKKTTIRSLDEARVGICCH